MQVWTLSSSPIPRLGLSVLSFFLLRASTLLVIAMAGVSAFMSSGTLSLPAVKVLESWIEHALKQRDAPAPCGRQLGYIYPKGLSPDGCQDAFAELSGRGPGGQYEEITRTTLFNALMLLGDNSNSGTLPPRSLAAPGRQPGRQKQTSSFK